MPSDGTETLAKDGRRVRTWRLEVTSGPSKGLVRRASEGVFRIGSAASNEICIDDPKISRHHLQVTVRSTGLLLRDLASKNGSYYQGSRIDALELPLAGAVVSLGHSELLLAPDEAVVPLDTSPRERCGRLLGQSASMRRLFAQIERVARSPATVLVHGETGTGKELVAEALHELGARPNGPFEVIDCAAIPRDLIESELFGHVRGAFTGATADRRGALTRASGGTIFLDEIGELALELQPKLLRVLEAGTIKPVGGDHPSRVDVRVVAASHRDLAEEVRAGRFREDLFFRLSVVGIEVPPLRDRLDDLPILVDHLLRDLGAQPLAPDGIRALAAYRWPGNVRQLRNVLERAAAMAAGGALVVTAPDLELPSARQSPSRLMELPYKDAKDEMVARFTREYLEALLLRHDGNVSAAARESQLNRNWIVALARRHGVRVRE